MNEPLILKIHRLVNNEDYSSVTKIRFLKDLFQNEWSVFVQSHKVKPSEQPREKKPKSPEPEEGNFNTSNAILKVLESGMELSHGSIKTNVKRLTGKNYTQLSSQLTRMVEKGLIRKTENGYTMSIVNINPEQKLTSVNKPEEPETDFFGDSDPQPNLLKDSSKSISDGKVTEHSSRNTNEENFLINLDDTLTPTD